MQRSNLIWLVAVAACGENLTPTPEAPLDPIACTGNRDGILTAAELPIALDRPVDSYLTTTARDWDLRGEVRGGSTVWTLDAELADDVIAESIVRPLGTQWYAADFAGADFVIAASDDIDAVYHQDDQGLWLWGTASRTPGAGQTLIVYDAPVAALRYPLALGDIQDATATIDGTVSGLPFRGTDAFHYEVFASGRADLPYVRFSPVLAVRSAVVREDANGNVRVTNRSTSFLFECAGELARAEAALDEPDPAFTRAVRMRRFAL